MIVTVTPNPVLDVTLTVPEIVIDEMARATDVREDWGGKGFNVSRALLALGGESVALGFVGGATGAKLTAGLRVLGIPTDFVAVAGETRTNIVISDGTHYVKVNQAGPTVGAGDLAALMDKVRQRAAPGDLWVLSGSLPPGVPASFYAGVIRELRAHSVWVLLDANGEALRLGCQAQPYLVKPNAIEAQELTGIAIHGTDDARRAAAAILDDGVTQVALSLGAAGLLLATRDSIVVATPPKVTARNVIGAGDALLAGVADALARGLPLAEQARWGVAVGTASAMREGVSVVTRAEVEAIYAKVKIIVWRD
ncbi:MAG TPA: 1-phosphofructokinase family hexose kinase [Anaerolineae bacterium]|nr:1-phosphofructokinase family hexose kinase [Anaerolineae bacterium]